MKGYEDENVNTINLPKQKQQPNSLEYNLEKALQQYKNSAIMYKLSIKSEEEDHLHSKEFEELIKEIIETKNDSFLQGKINLIEYLISKYSINQVDTFGLSKLTEISLKVEENFIMLNEFGTYMPLLNSLNLSGSCLKSIEELGSSFTNLLHLNVSNCKLVHLTGIICFTNLQKFDCSNNSVNDLIELEMSSSIQWLDLSNNQIEEEENILFLNSLMNLTYLNMGGNPIVMRNKREYTKLKDKYLSHVRSIDD